MSTNIYTHEKAPLLPLTNEEECQRLDCCKNKSYKTKYRRQSLFAILFFVLFFSHISYHEDIMRRVGGSKDGDSIKITSLEPVQSLSTFDTIAAFSNENKMDTYSFCVDKPTIPFTGLSKFEFNANEFPKLSIEQKTNSRRGQSISLIGGEAVVYEDKSVSKVTVEFDLKFNNKELENVYWIEKIQHTEKGLYELNVKTNDVNVDNGCITIDITVRVPNAAALDNFSLSLSNGGVVLKKGLTFKELAVYVANGNVQLSEGITSARTGFVVANGHVAGTIDTLSDELHVSIANGHSQIVIKEIDQTLDIPISFRISNGYTDLQVPTSFNSTFDLISRNGKRVIDSSIPQNIHSKTSKWGKTTGYYGDNDQTKNSISLSASNGRLHLNYA